MFVYMHIDLGFARSRTVALHINSLLRWLLWDRHFIYKNHCICFIYVSVFFLFFILVSFFSTKISPCLSTNTCASISKSFVLHSFSLSNIHVGNVFIWFDWFVAWFNFNFCRFVLIQSQAVIAQENRIDKMYGQHIWIECLMILFFVATMSSSSIYNDKHF